jgi:hypothetical protein
MRYPADEFHLIRAGHEAMPMPTEPYIPQLPFLVLPNVGNSNRDAKFTEAAILNTVQLCFEALDLLITFTDQ